MIPGIVVRASLLALTLPLGLLALSGACALDVDTATYIGGGSPGAGSVPTESGAPAAPDRAPQPVAGDGFDGGDGASPPRLDAYAAAVLADQPAFYFRLDDTGSPLRDASGHGVIASATNLAWGAPGAVAGNAAVHLDGASSVIDVGDAADFTGTAPFSLEAWVAVEVDDATYRHLFAKDFTGAAGREEFGVYIHTGQLAFERWVDDAATATQVDLSGLGTPSFVHSVAVYDGSAIILYAQGNEVGRTADARAQPTKPTSLFVGTKGAGFGTLQARLDEVAVYDHALSAARVKAHFGAAAGN
jgi:hypothetical protein